MKDEYAVLISKEDSKDFLNSNKSSLFCIEEKTHKNVSRLFGPLSTINKKMVLVIHYRIHNFNSFAIFYVFSTLKFLEIIFYWNWMQIRFLEKTNE